MPEIIINFINKKNIGNNLKLTKSRKKFTMVNTAYK